MLKNPFCIYILSFGLVLEAYQLGWSKIYPGLSFDLVFFFIGTFIVAVLLAMIIGGTVRKTQDYQYARLSRWVFPALLMGYVADMVYNRGIPLWMLITKQAYIYTDFGIPTLHVAIMTISGAFAAIRFADYFYSQRRRYLFEALIPLVYYVMIANRGAVLFAVVSFMFVIRIKIGRISVKRGIYAVVMALLLLYGFGVLGNIRSPGGIEGIGQPTTNFINSIVPRSYFWTYIYLTSPMGNFEEAVKSNEVDHPGAVQLVISEMLPDFISKRILPLLNVDRIETPRISPSLNVSTIFSRSYGYLGWTGPVLMFLYLSVIVIFYLRMIRRSPYRVPCLALLNTMIVFCIFDNMIAFSGMSLQLVWPLVFDFFKRTRKFNPVATSMLKQKISSA